MAAMYEQADRTGESITYSWILSIPHRFFRDE